jgi:hypothetical protein
MDVSMMKREFLRRGSRRWCRISALVFGIAILIRVPNLDRKPILFRKPASPHTRDHSKRNREDREHNEYRHQPDPIRSVIKHQSEQWHNCDADPETERNPLDAVQILLSRK